jgi:hypothetical protein
MPKELERKFQLVIQGIVNAPPKRVALQKESFRFSAFYAFNASALALLI